MFKTANYIDYDFDVLEENREVNKRSSKQNAKDKRKLNNPRKSKIN